MAKKIEAAPILISQYLKLTKSEYFVIPEYQRGYSWDITKCDTLWQDIEDFSGGDDPYFFGTIIMDCSLEEKDGGLRIVDGQQRTTTFFLLLKALLLRLNEVLNNYPNDEKMATTKEELSDKRKEIMKILYKKSEIKEINEMLQDPSKMNGIVLLENKSINETYKNELEIIIEAKDFETTEENVSKIKFKQKDNRYTNYFRNFKYFYEKLDKTESRLYSFAQKFLEDCQIILIRSWQKEQAITMFNSLNSKGMPLSDADIISAELYKNADNSNNDFRDQWEEIKELAEELEALNIVDIDAGLMQLMYINRAHEKEYQPNNVTVPGLKRYYTEIEKGKKLLKDPNGFCKKLNKIFKTWNIIRDYPIVKLLLKFNENVKLYLAGYLYRYEPNEITVEKVQDICECLLRLFTILELVDIGYSSKNFKVFLFNINLKLVNKDITISDIVKEFNVHIKDNWKKEELIKEIAEYDKNILVFLNDYLYAKSKGKKFDFKKNVNIEHIMPGSGREKHLIRVNAGITDIEQFNNIVNKIGNKILLEEKINKGLGDDWFKIKTGKINTQYYSYKNSEFAIAQALTEYSKPTWGKEDIDEATKKAAERIVKFIFQT